MRRDLLVIAVLALGCVASEPEPTRLYFRSAVPDAPDRFPRINPDQWDLGSLSASPPTSSEYRACGDVVLFGGEADALPAGRVAALDWNLWWSTGTGRVSMGMLDLTKSAPVATHREAACEWAPDDPRRDGDLRFTSARTLLDEPIERTDFYLAVEGTGSDVRVWSCPDAPSHVDMWAESPPAPFRPSAPIPRSGCAYPSPNRLPEALPALPTASYVLPPRIGTATTFGADTIAVMGRVEVRDSISFRGTTVVFVAGPRGEFPHLVVEEGGMLSTKGARFAAADPALGFRVSTARGVEASIVESRFEHPGILSWDERGRPRPDGVVLRGPAQVVGGAFLHGLGALSLSARGSSISGTRFVSNATALTVSAPDISISDVESSLDGLFLLVDDGADGLRLDASQILEPRAAGIRVHASRPDMSVTDVTIAGADSAGIAFADVSAFAGVRFDEVEVEACGSPIDLGFVPPGGAPPTTVGLTQRITPEKCPSRR